MLRIFAMAGALCLVGCDQPTANSDPGTTEAVPAPPQPSSELEGNIREIIATGLAEGKTEIVIPPGRYRAVPVNREHLRFEGLKGVTIVADGVDMICTETTRAITIQDCENLTIRGLTIDYDPLPYTQARILSISDDKSQLEVEIIDGYPDAVQNTGSLEIFDPATGRLRGRVTYFSTRCEPSGERRATLIKSRSQPEVATEQVGDIAVIKFSHAPGGEIPHAIAAAKSRNLTFDNVTLHAANSFGFFENACDGSRYISCRVDRRPPDSDPVPRAHPRLRSLNADAYHSKNAEHGPVYDRCVAKFMGDDAIAINGDFHFVTRCEGEQLRVLSKHDHFLKVGDDVQIFTYGGTRLEGCKVVSIEPDGGRTEEETAFLSALNMNDRLRTTAMQNGYLVTLDRAVTVAPGTLICSAQRIGNGFAIRDCELGFNRSRGILVKAGWGEITGNTIEASAMTAILVSPEYWWLEAGLSDDLLIANNTIRDGGGIGIAIVAVSGNSSLAAPGAFRNITLRNNTISGGAMPGMVLASIRNLIDEGNSVETDPAKALFSWEVGPWGKAGLQPVVKVNIE